MSDALTYLMQIRPEAMEGYFSFIKKSGEHLDEKTRALISVITKVDKQTDSGFRQYLKRALRAGSTPNEIIDALFAAFPTLGLSKIVWAMDIVLEMDLPEFRPENLSARPEWRKVIRQEELKDGVKFIENCNGRDLFVYRNEDDIRVYDSLCPHQATAMSEQALNGWELTCPKHKWKFDIRSGTCVAEGTSPLKSYDCQWEENWLMALW